MGRVVSGSALSDQRYKISVPVKTIPVETREYSAGTPAQFDWEAVIRASHRIVDESSNDARDLINEARERAKSIVAKALDMAAELEEKGYRDGLARAAEEHDAAMREAIEEAHNALHAVVDIVRHERRQFFLNAEKDIIDLAMAVAKKVLQREVEKNPEVTTEVVRAALKRLSERDQVTIRVSPADLDAIRSHREEFLHESDIEDLRIIADPRVDRGGVIIETDAASIDGRLDAQMQMAQDSLMTAMGVGMELPS